MNFEQYLSSLSNSIPPEGLSGYLKALWYDAKNDWEKSHELAQKMNDQTGSLIHAYLHRKEGDQPNAGYWYRRAGKPAPSCSLEEEWKKMVNELL